MPLPSDDVRAQLAKLRSEFAERAALHSEYEREMSSKYIHEMIPFDDWLAMRNAPQGKAKGGFVNDNHRQWFGDSKVVDAKGNPLKMYHGTDQDFTQFKAGLNEPGIFFTSSPIAAEPYSIGLGKENGRTIPAHLSIKNPYHMTKDELQSLQLDQNGIAGGIKGYVKELKKAGYDGIYVPAEKYDGGPKWDERYHDVWIAFHPTQIKSAIGNRGTYDPTNPDITKAKGGRSEEHTSELQS